MQKLLCIAPHLSTGGLPQYLTKKIELLNVVNSLGNIIDNIKQIKYIIEHIFIFNKVPIFNFESST
jgi:hypothetical protein